MIVKTKFFNHITHTDCSDTFCAGSFAVGTHVLSYTDSEASTTTQGQIYLFFMYVSRWICSWPGFIIMETRKIGEFVAVPSPYPSSSLEKKETKQHFDTLVY